MSIAHQTFSWQDPKGPFGLNERKAKNNKNLLWLGETHKSREYI